MGRLKGTGSHEPVMSLRVVDSMQTFSCGFLLMMVCEPVTSPSWRWLNSVRRNWACNEGKLVRRDQNDLKL